MTFKETQFPVKEKLLAQPGPVQSQCCQFPELDTESDLLALDLVNLAQPSTRCTTPGPSALVRPVTPPHQIVLPWLGLGIFNKMDMTQGGLL